MGEGSGMGLFEADSAEEMYAHLYNWAPSVYIDIKPVVTDEECRRIGKKQPSQAHTKQQPIIYNKKDGMIFYMVSIIHLY